MNESSGAQIKTNDNRKGERSQVGETERKQRETTSVSRRHGFYSYYISSKDFLWKGSWEEQEKVGGMQWCSSLVMCLPEIFSNTPAWWSAGEATQSWLISLCVVWCRHDVIKHVTSGSMPREWDSWECKKQKVRFPTNHAIHWGPVWAWDIVYCFFSTFP